MEWMAPKQNFYALYACIRNAELNATKALQYFDIKECDKLKAKKPRVKTIFTLKENELIELYVNQRLTQEKIGQRMNVSQACVAKYIKLYGIKSRNRGGIQYEQNSFDRQVSEGSRVKIHSW